ncbi:PLP-dependent cysteine synthase family protein [Mycolicibacterium sp. P1-5]|uniref:PLP-dependent cysteine synthase family protein n=1 Tax=Mycolicibacterium sp. P1-5 TaxID=2024617 RepID=UPI0011EF9880|nr:pyridoxal-phosphate dependent enzyme [Mycolicibacterium sp. P1-5]KAA0099351.1 pyridoxal-phosphate dependent enzyme [Mycolicibacterium sp. P1-5]
MATRQKRIFDDVTRTVGNTPLVRLANDLAVDDIELLVKLEYYNPTASVKDRLSVGAIDFAEKSGQLQPGGTIVAASSGNLGIGLAAAGAARGYRVVIVIYEDTSYERKVVVQNLGAELVLTPKEDGVRGSVEEAERIADSTPGAFFVNQFIIPINREIHRRTTGPEIWRDTDGDVDAVVIGVGSGGTISGVGAFLKEKNPGIKIFAVEPDNSAVLSGEEFNPHKIYGLGPNFKSPNFADDVVDEILRVTEHDAADTARELARQAGIPAGLSGGAAVAAARQVAGRRDPSIRTIVTIVPDSADRYISSFLFQDAFDVNGVHREHVGV